MTDSLIFLFGLVVTLICAGAISLLLWAAVEDGKPLP
jgi:hypothetical protein